MSLGSVLMSKGAVSSGSDYASTSGEQVENQCHKCDNQQQVNQAAADVEAEAEKPQDEKNRDDHPKHIDPFLSFGDTRIIRDALTCTRASYVRLFFSCLCDGLRLCAPDRVQESLG
jgi:hypothetical protein